MRRAAEYFVVVLAVVTSSAASCAQSSLMILCMSAVRSEIYRQAAILRCALPVIDALTKNAARWMSECRFLKQAADVLLAS